MKKKSLPLRIVWYIVTLRWLVVGLVLFYQKFISPLLPDSCIYEPTCSTYMLQAIKAFGVGKGVLLGIRRIIRCRPGQDGGFDPVPPNPKGDMKWLF